VTGPAFDELLRRLVEADARFVLIGGLAVNAWGVVRGTKDVDIVPDPDLENLKRIAEVAVAADGHVQTRDMIAGSAFSITALMASGERVLINTALGPLDVVQGLPGVPAYHELRRTSVDVEVLGIIIAICSLADLRTMKRTAGRTRDLADLEDLHDARPE